MTALPAHLRTLAVTLAPLAQMLRDSVTADVGSDGPMLAVYTRWNGTLFPPSDVSTFADSFAQTVMYALMLAHTEGAPSPLSARTAVSVFDDQQGLFAQVLTVAGSPSVRSAVGLLAQAVGTVEQDALADRRSLVYFYEHFLGAYDPAQRDVHGVFYTPEVLVDAQVRLVRQMLVGRFGKADGFGDQDVVTLDPAAGAGIYPLSIVTQTVEGVVSAARGRMATVLAQNLNAYELLVGPYAMAHLQMTRVLVEAGADIHADGVNVCLVDTLASPSDLPVDNPVDNPVDKDVDNSIRFGQTVDQVNVIIGNPPWDLDQTGSKPGTRRKGGIVRYNNDGTPGLIDDYLAPLRRDGTGVHAKSIYNSYTYFWRYGTWQVCEQSDAAAIVALVTPSSFLKGPGFAGMREHMRRQYDDIWVIDMGGNGRSARKDANVFEGVISPSALVIASRSNTTTMTGMDVPASVRYRKIEGDRPTKLGALETVTCTEADPDWGAADNEWGAPFVPSGTSTFHSWVPLVDVFPWVHSGVLYGRTWPIGETREVLERRWERLVRSEGDERADLFVVGSTTIDKEPVIPGGTSRMTSIRDAKRDARPMAPARYIIRSFDRHWVFPDPRLAHRLREVLWLVMGPRQVFLSTMPYQPLGYGPAVTVSAFPVDFDAFGSLGQKGNMPLWRDSEGTIPNVTGGLAGLLEGVYGRPVSPEDIAAYVVGIMGTRVYVDLFHQELGNRSSRVPFTADPELFNEAVRLGRDLIWWGTYGAQYGPDGNTRLPAGTAKNTVAVTPGQDAYPEKYSYNPDTMMVTVGDGQFGPVEPEVWAFQVSGLKVVQSWLGYRMKVRSGKKSSPLDDIRPDSWTFSGEFLELLWVIEHFVVRTVDAAVLLGEVVDGELIDPALFPAPTDTERKAPKIKKASAQDDMFG